MTTNIKTSVCVNEVRATLNNFDTYEIDHEPLGSGGFGVIYKGIRKSDGKEFALKFFGYTDRVPNATDINSEIVLMLTLAGVEGVIQIESIFYDSPMGLMPNKQKALQNSYPVIVMESLTGGDLLHRIDARARQHKPISERFLAQTFKCLMTALDSLHKRFYIHRDIKLANVLLVTDEDDSPVKLIDLGSIIQLDRATMTIITNDAFGTPRFMAPESLGRFNKEYSMASDIWQSGCVLFYMLCADRPFQSDKEIREGKYNTESPTHPRLSPEAKDLIARMLTVKPAERITMEEVLAHPWLAGNASDNHLGCDHTERVKTLNIRRKLQRVFKVRHVTSPPPPLPPPSAAHVDAMHFYHDDDDVTSWTDSDIETEARYYFNVFDRDGDGLLTKEDLRTGVAKFINDISGADHNDVSDTATETLRLTPGVKVNVDEMFDVIDTDHTRSVDFEAFRLFYVDVLMPSVR